MNDRELLIEAIKIMSQAQKHTAPGTPTAPTIHGPDGPGAWSGLLSYPGVQPDMYSAILTPMSLIDSLTAGVSKYDRVNVEMFTGITETDDDCAENSCSEYPEVGGPKTCLHTFHFGDVRLSTPERRLHQLGTRVDIGETERQAVNLAMMNFKAVPQFPTGVDINNQLFWDIYSMNHNLIVTMEKVLFQGNYASGNCAGNWARRGISQEWHGFDQLINTGIVDAQTGDECPAADSIVEDFSNDICDMTLATNIVELVANVYYRLKYIAEASGALPSSWFIAMQPDLFHALTRCWPCGYLTDGCNVGEAAKDRQVVTGPEQIAMRDEMRTNKFLWILGERVPVKTTQGPAMPQLGPGFESDLYFINTMASGRRSTWVEFQDMNSGGEPMQYAGAFGMPALMRVVSGGAWQVTPEQLRDCIKLNFAARPRLITRTPFLNARITDLQFSLPGYTRQPDWDDPYYVDGGRERRPTPSLGDPWTPAA